MRSEQLMITQTRCIIYKGLVLARYKRPVCKVVNVSTGLQGRLVTKYNFMGKTVSFAGVRCRTPQPLVKCQLIRNMLK